MLTRYRMKIETSPSGECQAIVPSKSKKGRYVRFDDVCLLKSEIIAITKRIEASYAVVTPLKELSSIVYDMHKLSDAI